MTRTNAETQVFFIFFEVVSGPFSFKMENALKIGLG